MDDGYQGNKSAHLARKGTACLLCKTKLNSAALLHTGFTGSASRAPRKFVDAVIKHFESKAL